MLCNTLVYMLKNMNNQKKKGDNEMITITFDESNEIGRILMNIVRVLKQSVKNPMIHINYENDDMTDEEMSLEEKEEILNDIREGLRELKLVREGKIKPHTVEELLQELEDCPHDIKEYNSTGYKL